MTNTPTPEKVLEAITALMPPNHKGSTEALSFSESESFINQFSSNEQSIKFIYDAENFKILNFTDNFGPFFGYTNAEIKKHNLLLGLRVMHFDHILFPFKAVKWSIQMQKAAHQKKANSFLIKTVFVGVKMRHKNGQPIRLLIRYTPFDARADGNHTKGLVSIDDITHLMKGNSFWINSKFGAEGSIAFHYSSTYDNYQSGDILSEREKEILNGIAQGLETKAIAQLLFLSAHTVDTHRRNMIARTDVRDTTALVQICKMGGII
jgi:DNA-binding CsgD family transcriptional regulator